MESFKELLATAELFLPRHCAVCSATGCEGGLCRLCQRIVGLQLARPQPVPELSTNLPIIAAGQYNGILARCLLGYKEHLRTDLLDVLSSGLARSLNHYPLDNPLVLVPIPSSSKSIGRRGFSPALELALEARKKIPANKRRNLMVADSLQRVVRFRKTAAQKQMGRFDRQRQIQGSMKIARGADFSSVVCLLIDDVVTTGASLQEGQKVLESAGATVLGAATVAWVRRQREVE